MGNMTKTGVKTSKPAEGSDKSFKIELVWNAVQSAVSNKAPTKLLAAWKPKANSNPSSIKVIIPKKKPVPM